jgi:hypothetical protein
VGWIIQLNKLFMKTIIFTSFIIMGISGLMAQLDCDPSLAPQNLQSIYTPGVGAQLSWDVVPGSQGVQLKVELPGGSNISKRIIGIERDQFLVPDLALGTGTYSWRVQAACSTIFPYALTPFQPLHLLPKAAQPHVPPQLPMLTETFTQLFKLERNAGWERI